MPGSKEEEFKKNNAFLIYDLYGHAQHKNPCPGGHEIYNFGGPFLEYKTSSLYPQFVWSVAGSTDEYIYLIWEHLST